MKINCSMTQNYNQVNINNNNRNNYQRAYCPTFKGNDGDVKGDKPSWLKWIENLFSPKKTKKTEAAAPVGTIRMSEAERKELYNKTCDAYLKRLDEKHGLKVSEIYGESDSDQTTAVANYKGETYDIVGRFVDKLTFLNSLSAFLDGAATDKRISLRYVPGDIDDEGDVAESEPKNPLEEKYHKMTDYEAIHDVNEELRQERYEEELQYLKDKYNIEMLDEDNSKPTTSDRIGFMYDDTKYVLDIKSEAPKKPKDRKEFVYDFARFLDGFNDMQMSESGIKDNITIKRVRTNGQEEYERLMENGEMSDKEKFDFLFDDLDLLHPKNDFEQLVADVKRGKKVDEYLAQD